MTTVELDRIARDVVPPVGATGWRLTVDGPTDGGRTGFAVVPIIGGRRDGRPVFQGSQRDCARMYELLTGRTPTSRGARGPLPVAVTGDRETDLAFPEAPQSLTSAGQTGVGSGPRADASGERTPGGASPRLCAGCDQPLPEDGRSDRTTHGGACRIAAFRRRAAENSARADADSESPDVTDSRRSAAPASRSSHEAGHPGPALTADPSVVPPGSSGAPYVRPAISMPGAVPPAAPGLSNASTQPSTAGARPGPVGGGIESSLPLGAASG